MHGLDLDAAFVRSSPSRPVKLTGQAGVWDGCRPKKKNLERQDVKYTSNSEKLKRIFDIFLGELYVKCT